MSRSLSVAPPPSSKRPQAFTLEEGLWFGDFDDASARDAAQASMAAMAGRVMGARPFPEAAQRLVQLTREDDADFTKVVRVLEMDPGLSQRVLRLVNSAGYGLRIRCTSISHAAALLGQLKLRQIATSAVLFDHFGKPSAMTRKKQEHGSLVASLCRYLAIHLGLPQDDLFTIGLLHDLGQLMMLDDGDPEYAALVDSHDDGFDTLHLAERELLGFDHAVLAGQVLASWSIPSPVPEVISLHHQPAIAHQRGLDIAAMVQTLRFADQMAHLLEAGNKRHGPTRLAESEAASYLDFSEVQIAAMWRDLEKVHEATKNRRLNILDIAPRSVSVPRSLAPRDRGISMAPSRRGESLNPMSIPSYSQLVPSFSNYPLGLEPSVKNDELRIEPVISTPPEKSQPQEESRKPSHHATPEAAPKSLPSGEKSPSIPSPESFEQAFLDPKPEVRKITITELDPSPEVFPCSICYSPTFGARCPACGAHVCNDHQTANNWCQACEDEYQEHRKTRPLNGLLRLFGGVGVLVAFLSSWFFSGLLAALTILGLGLIILFGVYVAYQAFVKIRFKQTSHLRAALRERSRISSTGLPSPILRSRGPQLPVSESAPEESVAPEADAEAPPPSLSSTRIIGTDSPVPSNDVGHGSLAPMSPSLRIAVGSIVVPGVASLPAEPLIQERTSERPVSSEASLSRRPESVSPPSERSSRLSSPPGSRGFPGSTESFSNRPTEEEYAPSLAPAALDPRSVVPSHPPRELSPQTTLTPPSETLHQTSLAPPSETSHQTSFAPPSELTPQNSVTPPSETADESVRDEASPSAATQHDNDVDAQAQNASLAPSLSAPETTEGSLDMEPVREPTSEGAPVVRNTLIAPAAPEASPAPSRRAAFAVTEMPSAASHPPSEASPSETHSVAAVTAPSVAAPDALGSETTLSDPHPNSREESDDDLHGDLAEAESAPNSNDDSGELATEEEVLDSLNASARDEESPPGNPPVESLSERLVRSEAPVLSSPALSAPSELPLPPQAANDDSWSESNVGEDEDCASLEGATADIPAMMAAPLCEAATAAVQITPPVALRPQFCEGRVGTVKISGPLRRPRSA